MNLVFDAEGNELYEKCTTIWCIVAKDIETKELTTAINHGDVSGIEMGLDFLHKADMLIGHNILGYDLPVFKKLYGWEPREEQRIVDTYVLSRLLNPDRRGHGIAYWGEVFGREKPDHEDWSQYSDDMLHRCTEDVEINYMTYIQLLKEIRGAA